MRGSADVLILIEDVQQIMCNGHVACAQVQIIVSSVLPNSMQYSEFQLNFPVRDEEYN